MYANVGILKDSAVVEVSVSMRMADLFGTISMPLWESCVNVRCMRHASRGCI